MAILRIFRIMTEKANQTEVPKVNRIRKHGPHDLPAGLREPHSYMRSLDGRW